MKEDDFPLHSEWILTEKQLAAIGSVAIEATYLEREAAHLIWSLLGTDAERGHLVTFSLSLAGRLDLVRDLLEKRLSDSSDLEALKVLIGQGKEYAAKRNTIIHGDWTTPVKNFFQLMTDGAAMHPPATAINRSRRGSTELSADKIMSVARQLSECRSALAYFVERVLPEEPYSGL